MISILFYSCFIINLMIVCKRQKSNYFAFIFWCILLLVYSGNCRDGFSDLTHYRYAYQTNMSSFYFDESGYGMIADWFSTHGVSFHIFLAFIFIICSFFIYLSSHKLNCNYNLLLTLYSLFYIFYCMEGIRFFIAMSILTYGYYVLSSNKKGSMFFSIILFVFAYFFHTQSLFLIPFIIFYKIKNNKWKKYFLFTFCSLLIILNLFNGNSANYILNLAPSTINNTIKEFDIATYMNSSTRFGFILYDLYFIFNLAISYNLHIVGNVLRNENDKIERFFNLNYQANLYSLLFMPFVMFNSTFFRFTLINCNFNFIALSMVCGLNKKNILDNKKYMYCTLLIILFTLLWWILRENVIWFYEAIYTNIFN